MRTKLIKQINLEKLSFRKLSTVTKSTPIHLESLKDLNPYQIQSLVLKAVEFKHQAKQGIDLSHLLANKSLALIFSKRSTRTRLATETAANLLGARTFYLGKDDIQLGVNESLRDSAIVISSMVDGIMARVHAHEEIKELTKYSSSSVINALSDLYHPTQILADLMTMYEAYCKEQNINPKDSSLFHALAGKKVTWIGDVNNVLNSMLVTLPKFKIHLSVGCPEGLFPVNEVWKISESEAVRSGAHLEVIHEPEQALKGADVIVTDTWISMGEEAQAAQKLARFQGFQVTNQLLTKAGVSSNFKFLHCLPRKQHEVDDAIFYSSNSLVFQEAENRKWTIMAVIYALLSGKGFEGQ